MSLNLTKFLIQVGLCRALHHGYTGRIIMVPKFQDCKDYIDLAVDMKWPYSLIDAEWNEMSNGGDIEDLITYSLSRNIKPMIWYNSSTAWMGPGPLYRLNSKENRIKEYTWLQKVRCSRG